MTIGPAAKWVNDQAITDLNLSSTYQTQSGLDSAVTALLYQKASEVSSSISSALGSSGFELHSHLGADVTALGFELNSSLDLDVGNLGYTKTAGANATNVNNLVTALGAWFTVFEQAATLTDPGTSAPFDYTALTAALGAFN